MNELKVLTGTKVTYSPRVARKTGSVISAIFLQQMLYWWERKKDEMVYKSIHELENETALSRYQQDTAIKKLVKMGFIEVVCKGSPPIRHFRVRIQKIINALKDENGKCGNPANQIDEKQQINLQESNNLNCKKTTNQFVEKQHNELLETDKSICGKTADRFVENQQNLYTKITTKNTTENTTKITFNDIGEKEISPKTKTIEIDFEKENSITNVFRTKHSETKKPEKSSDTDLTNDEKNTKFRSAGGDDSEGGKTKSLHKGMKEIFQAYYHDVNGLPYYWTGKDGNHLKQLIRKIEFLMESEKMIINDDSITEQFRFIVQNITDQWTKENLSISLVNSRFNEIVNKIKRQNNEQIAGDTQCCTSDAFKKEVYQQLLGREV
jgi:hypothetical protein